MRTKGVERNERLDSRLFMSERDVARELDISPSTMTRLNQRGELPEGRDPSMWGIVVCTRGLLLRSWQGWPDGLRQEDRGRSLSGCRETWPCGARVAHL